MIRTPLVILCLALPLLVPAVSARADDAAESTARHAHVQAIEALMATTGDEPLKKFAGDRLAPSYRDTFAAGKLIEHLREVRTAVTNFGGLMVNRGDDGAMHMKFLLPAIETTVLFRMQPAAPYLITAFEVEGTNATPHAPALKPITWETLDSRLDEEAKKGFAGCAYVVHDGKVVLAKGYGEADRNLYVPNSVNTIFAIGSTPIDFTRAAVLKLEETGKLKTSDSIAKYFPDVPADKRAITIDQLMSATSGLPNFHHVPGVDADPDLTWIDRNTALNRIFGQPLLFKPGEGHAHSHSAWVLLAALVEKVSGQSYGDYVDQALFKPLGMKSTFLHEGLRMTDDRRIATGYEGQSVGKNNSPKYWGRTSWLVMGSGGMASTAEDLAKFFTAVRDGSLLSKKEAKKYGGEGGLWVGGDDRGFLCMHGERGNDMFILMSNAHAGPGDLASSIGEALGKLVLAKN